jgi:hypothetical protein
MDATRNAIEFLNSLLRDIIKLLEKECEGLEQGVVNHFFDKFFDDDLILSQLFAS